MNRGSRQNEHYTYAQIRKLIEGYLEERGLIGEANIFPQEQRVISARQKIYTTSISKVSGPIQIGRTGEVEVQTNAELIIKDDTYSIYCADCGQ